MVGEVEAASAPEPEEKIHPCPKEDTPVPPLLTARVVVAETTPLVAKRVPLKEPSPRVVVVAFVVLRFVDCRDDAKSVVEVAFVLWSVVEKKLVEVALVKVALVVMRLVGEKLVAERLVAKKLVVVALVACSVVVK